MIRGNTMKKFAALACLLMLPFVSAQASEPTPYEMPRSEVVPIKDRKADRQYELYIKLPEGYVENPDKKHPVIYTTDAAWHMDMLSGSTEFIMPDAILVGISWQKDFGHERAHASRFRDYLTVKIESASLPTGEASHHLSFIRDEVIKYVENHYRTDPTKRAYFGYSLGAAFGAYILFSEPDTFKHYILGSPAFSEQTLAYLDNLEARTAPRQQDLNANVYVTVGELETREMENVENFVSILKRRTGKGLALTGLIVMENADHSAGFPKTAVRGIEWLSRLTNRQFSGHSER